MTWFTISPELVHHGIKGQKWGVRNGPPYPLNDDNNARSDKKKIDNSKWKQYAKYGAIAGGVALAAIGAYTLSQSRALPSVAETGRLALQSISVSNKGVSYIGGRNPESGKSAKQIIRQTKMIRSINAEYRGTAEGEFNCAHCSLAYILNSMFGMSTTAKAGDLGGIIDPVSGALLEGRDAHIFNTIFDNAVFHEYLHEDYTLGEGMAHIPTGSTGIALVAGHFICYEKDADGFCTYINVQGGYIYNSNYEWAPVDCIIDLSKATVNEEAREIINELVNGY